MKKKIIFGLSIFALMFFFGGVYIITTMEATVFELHSLSALHRIVVLRKDLLSSVEANQSDIKFKYTRLAGRAGGRGNRKIVEAVERCTACHHPPPADLTIDNLKKQIETYQEMTQSIMTAAEGPALSALSVAAALQLGDDIAGRVREIIRSTSSKLDQREKEILNRTTRRKNILFLLVTVGPFFAVGLAFILINGLARPVNSLLDATRRLKAGDLDFRIRGLQGEFGEVADSFNEMAASLKKQMQEMQRTEQLRICGEMAAGLAHEIRNPLAGIKVSIEVLMAELEMDERDKAVLEKTIEQIRHIELLMKNLLNFARPAAAQPVTVNVNKIVERTISFIEKHPSFASPDSRKRIVSEMDDDLPDTYADPQQLQQVFLNLLLNAADATPKGGTITVRTCRNGRDGTIAVEVHDTGQGIPEGLGEKIFQPFFTTKGKGTGLGLAVSKRIVEEHGGVITASNDVAGGAVFSIVLPVRQGVQEGVMT